MIGEVRFTTQRSARAFTVGQLSDRTKYVWLACHGYGMDVRRFAQWFTPLTVGPRAGTHAVVCPEGLSRFYWEGLTGRPVASWMTRDDRLAEIDDLCAYLHQVHRHLREHAPAAKLVAFGFSQGAATIMRYLDRHRPPAAHVVLWSGTPPEDIDYAPRDYFATVPLHVRWGSDDPLVTWEQARARYEEVALPFAYEGFAGRHRVEREPLLALADAIASDQ